MTMTKMKKKWSDKKFVVGYTTKDLEEMNKKIWLNNINVKQKPKLIINSKCHSHIRALHISSPDTEWSAIAKIENKGNWVFEMTDMIHPEQTCSGAETSATDKGMEWAVDYLIKQWEDLSKWNCILHSHHHMGCFWSGTDNNARLWLNDWRALAWAVVSAYTWKPEDWEVVYKGCVNFYKPYNIEIDCDIEHWEDLCLKLLEYNNRGKKREQELEDIKKEIYEKKVQECKEEIDCCCDKPNYDSLLEYLWINIAEELLENYEEVQKKMPNVQVQEIYKRIAKETEEEMALIESDLPPEEDIEDEVLDWAVWSEALRKQLEDHKVKKYQSSLLGNYFGKKDKEDNYYWNLYDYNDYWNDWGFSIKKKSCESPEDSEEDYEPPVVEDSNVEYGFFYTKENYRNVMQLKDSLWLNTDFDMRLDKNWIWIVENPMSWKWEYVDNCIEDLYEFDEDFDLYQK